MKRECPDAADCKRERLSLSMVGSLVPGGRRGVRGSLESDAFQTQTHSLCPDVLPRVPLLGAAASASGWNGRGHFVRAFPFGGAPPIGTGSDVISSVGAHTADAHTRAIMRAHTMAHLVTNAGTGV